MAGQYTAEKKTVGGLLAFTSLPLKVPTWQRSYSWRTEEVATFWDDLVRFSERYPGEGVKGKEYFLGSVVMVDRADHLEVLDGQQRLATATILLSALRDVAGGYEPDAGLTISNDYVAKKDLSSGSTTFKLTMNNYDKKYFQEVVQRTEDSTPDAEFKSHRLIAKARKHLLDRVKQRYKDAGSGKKGYENILRLYDVLVNHLSVVEVKSLEEDSAAAVFETLNDRGIGLSTPDLLRNYLLMRAKDEAAREEIIDSWQQVFALGGDNTSVEDFLRHYWISTHGDIKAKALYREIKGDIEEKGTNPVTLSKSLAKAADHYQVIVGAEVKKRELRLPLEAVSVLNAKVLLPLLLSARESCTQGDQIKLATALVTTYVRHTLVGGLAGTELESVVFESAVKVRGKDAKRVKKVIADLRALAPSDAEFRKAFAKAEVGRRRSARYLLTAIEHQVRGTGELRVEDPDMVHVDHIYPQSPKAGERLANHDQLIDRLGNLTLLSKRLNEAQRNAKFSKKKADAYAHSDIKITKELVAEKKWNSAEIDRRQKKLAGIAVKVWPL
jgi:hypothetical protein